MPYECVGGVVRVVVVAIVVDFVAVVVIVVDVVAVTVIAAFCQRIRTKCDNNGNNMSNSNNSRFDLI